MSEAKSCPNCGREHGPLDACVLGVLAGVERDRNGAGFTTGELALVDASRFWDEIGGPAVDWLESHVTAQKIEAGWGELERLADGEASAGEFSNDELLRLGIGYGVPGPLSDERVRREAGERLAELRGGESAEQTPSADELAASVAASEVDAEPDQTDAEAYAPVVAERMGEQMIDWTRLMEAASDGALGDELADYNLTRERVEELELDPDAFDGENVDIAMQESVLAVESSRTFEVVFGTGGPDVRLLVDCDMYERDIEKHQVDVLGQLPTPPPRVDYEPRRVAIRYSWSGSREVALHGAAREAALEFARRVVPELAE